ncbi:histone-lysine N-methyltransferase SETMAR [Ditylenchus destructor]|nr:histone-lysine N-methyltransferase SETMAR [Ditylenchus destructor]
MSSLGWIVALGWLIISWSTSSGYFAKLEVFDFIWTHFPFLMFTVLTSSCLMLEKVIFATFCTFRANFSGSLRLEHVIVQNAPLGMLNRNSEKTIWRRSARLSLIIATQGLFRPRHVKRRSAGKADLRFEFPYKPSGAKNQPGSTTFDHVEHCSTSGSNPTSDSNSPYSKTFCTIEKNRGVIQELLKFEYELGHSVKQAIENMNRAKGAGTVAQSTAYEWYSKFKKNRMDIEDNPRSGRPREVDRDAVVKAQKFTPPKLPLCDAISTI